MADQRDIVPAPSVGMPVQRLESQHATAIQVQVPRKMAEVESRAIQEADLLGDMAYYGWGAGKNRVEGPSKALAMALVRQYGNCAVDLQPVQDLPDCWIFNASFVDLETGFTLMRQFRQSKKWEVYGRLGDARKEDVRFQIGQSKAIRNVVLNALPEWLVARCVDKAKGGVREAIDARIEKDGMEAVQKAAVNKLNKLGVSTDRILAAFGRPSMKALTVEDLVVLRGNVRAIETESDTIDSMFPPHGQQRTTKNNLDDKLASAAGQEAPATAQSDDGGDHGDAPTPNAPTSPPPPESDDGLPPSDDEASASPEPSPREQVALQLAERDGTSLNDATARLEEWAQKVLQKGFAELKKAELETARKAIAGGMIKPKAGSTTAE